MILFNQKKYHFLYAYVVTEEANIFSPTKEPNSRQSAKFTIDICQTEGKIILGKGFISKVNQVGIDSFEMK